MTKGSLAVRLIIIGLCSILPLHFFLGMLKADNQARVITDGVFLLGALYLYGLIASALFSGPAARTLVDFILYPRRYLKKAPPILSRQMGLIARKCYKEAEMELLDLRQKYKSSPEIALMLADLHASGFNAPEAALMDCRFYFKHRNWRYNELNLPIALRYADWQTQLGRKTEASEFLSREIKNSFYPRAEKKALLSRAASLGQQSAEK